MARPTAEQVFRAFLRGPGTTKTASNDTRVTQPWAGLVDVTTASAVASVATTLVDSDSIILFNIQQTTATLSGIARDVVVSSINPGVGFTFRTTDNVAPSVNMTVHWMLWRTQ